MVSLWDNRFMKYVMLDASRKIQPENRNYFMEDKYTL